MLIGALIDHQRAAGMNYIRSLAKQAQTIENQKLAVTAIGIFGAAADVDELIALLDHPSAEIAEAAQATLSTANNPAVTPAVLAALKTMPKSTNSLITIIAYRQTPAALPLLVDALSSPDGNIRSTALLALREQASEKELDPVFKMINKAQSPDEAKAAQKALFTLSKKYPAQATTVISAIYKESSAETKTALLQAIGIAGANEGLKLIESALQDKESGVTDTAMRVLASWEDPEVLDLLLTQSKAYPKESLRTLTLRNYITLCEKIEVPRQQLEALRKAEPLATRPEEKKLLSNAVAASEAAAKNTVSFKTKKIGSFRSEACGVADFNGDGKLDIVAGPYIYYAPDWKAFQYSPIGEKKVDEQGKGYYDDFFNLILDINKDGKPDILTGCWFTQENQWFENSGSDQAMWTRHLIEKLGNHETGKLEDIDGDGKALEFLPHTHITCWYEMGKTSDGKSTMIRHNVCENKNELGAGAGDINGDGRPDIIRPDVWFEAPEDIRKGEWKAHPLELGKVDGKITHTSNIIVFDVNKDGLNDLLATTAHKHGIFWYEQVRGADQSISWKEHVIDNSWSQAHYLAFADINNDGNKEIITGKRFMAHNGGDPDAYGKLCIYYYTFTPGPNPTFSRHAISVNEGISATLNIETVDMDGDGDLDLVTTGKFGGPVLLENQLK
jgi:HEAT repeat protein